ncbi:MAG: alpha/beta hydrolase domain-containing protein [Acidobacteriota bacterium]
MLSRVILACLTTLSLSAAVHTVRVLERKDFAGGKSFGKTGPYESIRAKATFLIDPTKPANANIADIQLAPRNADGMVEFASDIFVIKPTNPERGNGTILFEVSNRGGQGMHGTFNRAAKPNNTEYGDGLLYEQGYTLVWVGWQFDVPDSAELLRLYAPIATNNGAPITGLVRSEYVANEPGEKSFSLADRAMFAYPMADGAGASAQLTVRDTCTSERRSIPRDQWQLARLDKDKPVPDSTRVYIPAGLEPGKVYEVIYTAKNPVVVGLGPAAIRDFISFLKYGGPAAGMAVLGDESRYLKRAIGFGTSQSGRFLRTYVYDGFNANEDGKIVFDGVWAHVAGAGRGSFNFRFAQPSRDGHPHLNCLYPSDIFPFTDQTQTDPTMGSGGLLAKAEAAHTTPKIFYTNGSYEYWGRVASLIHTSIDGNQDMGLGTNSRAYYLAGTQHGPGTFPPTQGAALNLSNGNDYRWIMRGLLSRMNDWVTDGASPPPSQIPQVSKDSLVTVAALNWPKIPGSRLPQHPKEAYRGDFRAAPPKVGAAFPTLLPQVDADGNETAGIRAPMVTAPLATFTGWNFRKPSQGAPDELYSMVGSTFLLSKTKAERMKKHDPRPSIEERYKDRAGYVSQYETAARALAAQGFLNESDIPALVEAGGKQWDAVMVKSPTK